MDKSGEAVQGCGYTFAPARTAGEALPGGCLHHSPGGQAMKALVNATELIRIRQEEWQFDDLDSLPDDELEICFVYEYGREYVKHSQRWQKLIQQLAQRQAMGRSGSAKDALVRPKI